MLKYEHEYDENTERARHGNCRESEEAAKTQEAFAKSSCRKGGDQLRLDELQRHGAVPVHRHPPLVPFPTARYPAFVRRAAVHAPVPVLTGGNAPPA